VRFGLVGTGPWAELAHGPGLLAAEGLELRGVWGRRFERAQQVAGRLGVTAYDDIGALLDDVDAVAFAVPPDVQATLATRAARAGKHLLLDKPVATSLDAARDLEAAVARSGVSSVVFFTGLFAPSLRPWFDGAARTEGWLGASCTWLGDLDAPDNPFGGSPWRRQLGALWDIGPHAVAEMTFLLGPVTRVFAVGGAGDVVHVVLVHEGGVTSTLTLSLFAPSAAAGVDLRLWGDAGVTAMPQDGEEDDVLALATAARELASCAESGRPHALDVRLGTRVVEVLAEAESQVRARR
jgi:predicted dehydrogenase